MSTSALTTSHPRIVRTIAVATILVALTISIVLAIAARSPSTRSSSSGHVGDTSGAYENGWSTRTGGHPLFARAGS
jgi:hypothetical protein